MKKKNVTIITVSRKNFLEEMVLMYGDEFVFDLQRFESSGKSTTISEENSVITKGGLYKIAKGFKGTIKISTTDAVTLDGADAGNLENVHIKVASKNADLTIKDLNITNEYSGNVIALGKGKKNKLTLSGTNNLTCHYTTLINIGGGLTIDGDGSLKFESTGNCIGTSYKNSKANLAILGGNITAHVNDYGVYSAIGAGTDASMGDILIGGNATVEADGGCYGAGIGSGYDSSVGNIKITDNAYVSAKGNFGAGIGTADSSGLKDGKPAAYSKAGNITIDGNATVKSLSNMGAAIGNGSSYCGHTTVGDILIGGNASVEAICAIHDSGVGGGCGTGIGNGYTSIPGSTSTTGNITITDDAQVVAKNYGYGLGLGKGITEFDNTNTMGKITFSGGNVTIQNSSTEDSIEINGKVYSPEEKMVFVNGEFVADGNDAIINQTPNKTVTGTSNANLIYNYGSNVLINAKGGNDDIFNMSPDVTINAGNGNNFISSRDNNVSIKSGTGNDSISDDGWSNTIDAGDGNNQITNGGKRVSITTGAGNDSINNGSALVSINAGDGNDTIDNRGSFSMVDAGAGNDYIKISGGKNFTINAGKGDDFIEDKWKHGENILFTYAEGDGNDTIYGFNETSTLSIAGGSYSTQQSGSDVIVTVGDGKITLENAAFLSKLNISDKEKNSWKLNGKTATYGTQKKTLVTVKGVKSIDGISLKKKVVTVSDSSLNKKKVTVSDGYTLKLNKDVTKSTNQKAAWSLSGTTATYKSAYKTAGYALASDKKSITYSKATAASALATVKGAKSVKGLSVSGKKITLKNSALSKKVTIGGGYEFDFAKDYKNAAITGSKNADTITAHGTKVTINGGAGNDYLKSTGSKAKILGGAGNDSLWGGKGNDSLYGGSGDDTFIYQPGEGTDKIFDYQSGDLLKILKSNGTDGGYFTESSFKNGDLTLAISGGGKVIFDDVSVGDKFNINGKTHIITKNSLS